MGEWLSSVLRGHYRYYGVAGNFDALSRFRYEVARLWHHTLERRSQKARLKWERMARLIKRWLPLCRHTKACVADLRERNVTPHVARIRVGGAARSTAGTTRHAGYAISQRIRKRVEEIFGWLKTIGGFRRTRYVGLEKTQLAGYLVASAYNLVRMVRLVAAAVPA